MNEDALLDQIACEQYLAKLTPERRLVLMLTSGVYLPEDWNEPNLTYAAIGRYVGLRFRGEPLSEAAIRYIRQQALYQINPKLKESLKKSPKPPKTAKQRRKSLKHYGESRRHTT